MTPKLKRGVKFIVLLLVILVLGGANFSCVGVGVGPDGKISKIHISTKPGNQPPTINYFNASPSVISSGDIATLEWDVSEEADVTIDPEIGSVALAGSAQVLPTDTITYTLTASNAAGSVTESVTVTVASASHTPTPTPTPTPVPRLEGDVHTLGSGNGVIDSADLQLIAQHIVGTTTLTGDDFLAADVNDNDVLDSADLQLMAQYLVGTINEFPGGTYIP